MANLSIPGNPYFHKHKGKIIGVKFTPAQQKAIDEAIDKMTLEHLLRWNEQNCIDTDSIVMWILHKHFGFGPARCKKLWDLIYTESRLLAKHYQMETADGVWICRQLAKDAGIDVEQWYKDEGYVQTTD